MPNSTAGGRRTVRLVGVPVALYRAAQQHTDDLLREIVLMAGYEAAHGTHGPATRLADTADRHRAERLALGVTGERVVAAATAEVVTIEYDVEVATADSSAEWGRILDELGELCRAGAMLVVPASEDVVAFSQWFCDEFVRQLRDDAQPRPWPEYAAREGSRA